MSQGTGVGRSPGATTTYVTARFPTRYPLTKSCAENFEKPKSLFPAYLLLYPPSLVSRFRRTQTLARNFSMYQLRSLLLLISCFSFSYASPKPAVATGVTPAPSAEPTFTIAKRRRTHNCNQDDRLKKIEAKAWADAGLLAEIAAEYDNGNQWQPAMDLWMGSDSKDSGNFQKIQSKR